MLYTTLRTAILAGWGLAPGQPIPIIYNKALRYSTLYADHLFLTIYEQTFYKEISKDGKASRKQFISINGVYATEALATTAMLETKRILVTLAGVRVTGKGKIIPTSKRYTFTLPCFELSFI